MEFMRLFQRVIAIAVTFVIGLALGITGLLFLADATDGYRDAGQAKRLMISGLVVLGIGGLFAITALIMAFISGKPQLPAAGGSKT